jgi:hypothetical protein
MAPVNIAARIFPTSHKNISVMNLVFGWVVVSLAAVGRLYLITLIYWALPNLEGNENEQ